MSRNRPSGGPPPQERRPLSNEEQRQLDDLDLMMSAQEPKLNKRLKLFKGPRYRSPWFWVAVAGVVMLAFVAVMIIVAFI